MRVEATTDPGMLTAVYDEVLTPSFPADELPPLRALLDDLAAGELHMVVATHDGVLWGAALAQSSTSGIALLTHLAVSERGRGRGIGGRLLHTALDDWQRQLNPWLVLAEVEDPARHEGSAAHGDPTARLRFYRRMGARILPLPHVQPALRPGGERVRGLLLLALRASGDRLAGVESDGTWLVPAEPLRAFLEQYFTEAEGRPPDDDEWRGLADALADPVLRVSPSSHPRAEADAEK